VGIFPPKAHLRRRRWWWW